MSLFENTIVLYFPLGCLTFYPSHYLISLALPFTLAVYRCVNVPNPCTTSGSTTSSRGARTTIHPGSRTAYSRRRRCDHILHTADHHSCVYWQWHTAAHLHPSLSGSGCGQSDTATGHEQRSATGHQPCKSHQSAARHRSRSSR